MKLLPLSIGIVAGMPAELACFAPGIARERHAAGFETLDLGGRRVGLLCLGIGKVAAATAATLLARDGGARLLMTIGTAGSLGAEPG